MDTQTQPQSPVSISAQPPTRGAGLGRTLHRALVSLLVLLALGFNAFAQEDLLRSLVPSFKGMGVFVRTKWLERNAVAPPRPAPAPLRGFPVTGEPSSGAATFKELFNAGAFQEAALLAVNDGQAVAPQPKRTEFEGRWQSADKSQRVFISFTQKDVEAAKAVRSVLEENGYTCFMYVNEASQRPWTNSVKVGQFFRNAGVHLFIDSQAARQSAGVKLEAQALDVVEGRASPPREGTAGTTSRRPAPSGEGITVPCCKLCTYRRGVLVGCGPVTCGDHCHGAN